MTKCILQQDSDISLEELNSLVEESYFELGDKSPNFLKGTCFLKSLLIGTAIIFTLSNEPSTSILRSSSDDKNIEALFEQVESTYDFVADLQNEIQMNLEQPLHETIDEEDINSEIEIISVYMEEMGEFYANRKKNFRI